MKADRIIISMGFGIAATILWIFTFTTDLINPTYPTILTVIQLSLLAISIVVKKKEKRAEDNLKPKNTEQIWLHNRIVQVYGESRNVDFLHRMRKIIENVEDMEKRKLTDNCPECESTDIAELGYNYYYCRNCETEIKL